MKLVHHIMAFITLAVIGTGLFGLSTSCTPSTLPSEPDVVTYPDAGAPADASAVVDATPSPAPTPAPPLPGAPDASATCVAACAQLHAIPCAEGTDALCAAKCTQVQSAHLSPFDIACVIGAKTKTAARACAGIGASGCQ